MLLTFIEVRKTVLINAVNEVSRAFMLTVRYVNAIKGTI